MHNKLVSVPLSSLPGLLTSVQRGIFILSHILSLHELCRDRRLEDTTASHTCSLRKTINTACSWSLSFVSRSLGLESLSSNTLIRIHSLLQQETDHTVPARHNAAPPTISPEPLSPPPLGHGRLTNLSRDKRSQWLCSS
jgi:hypothetical protein